MKILYYEGSYWWNNKYGVLYYGCKTGSDIDELKKEIEDVVERQEGKLVDIDIVERRYPE